MNSGQDTAGLPAVGSPIRKSPGQSLFAAHRGLSQLTTSFIALRRQGILTCALSSLIKNGSMHRDEFYPLYLVVKEPRAESQSWWR
jgi:hypothetical protein